MKYRSLLFASAFIAAAFLATQRGARAFNPVAGLMAAVFYIEGEDGEAGLSVVVE